MYLSTINIKHDLDRLLTMWSSFLAAGFFWSPTDQEIYQGQHLGAKGATSSQFLDENNVYIYMYML